MTAATVAKRLTVQFHEDATDITDADYLLRRVQVSLPLGNDGTATPLTYAQSGCRYYFEKAANIRSLKISDTVGIADGAANFVVCTVGLNDGANGAITPIGHWSTETGQEGALTALHEENMAGFTDPTAVTAGQALVVTTTKAALGVQSNLVIHITYDVTG
jgi:hypothetical protein